MVAIVSLLLEFIVFDSQNSPRRSKPNKSRLAGPLWRDQGLSVIRQIWHRSLGFAGKALRGFLSFFQGLSGRLFGVTALFVLGFELLSLVSSLSAFQENWLIDRIRYAEVAAQAIEELPHKTVSRQGSARFLKLARARLLLIHINNPQSLAPDVILRAPDLEPDADPIDLRNPRLGLQRQFTYLWGPWKSLFSQDARQIRIDARFSSEASLSIIVPGAPLKTELKAYLFNSLWTTFLVALLFGVILFGLLSFFIVRPIQRLTGAVARFKANPEDVHAAPRLSGRADEIGQIEIELAEMQEEVRAALRSRARLAALGQAVSKINHDLRNMLTSAQMASDRLAASPDPMVAKTLPRLERALDRALSLAQNVLNYGKSDENPARIQNVRLRELAFAAAEDVGLLTASSRKGEGALVRFVFKAAKGFYCEADPEHLHRLLVNLMRNAAQAIEAQPNRKVAGRITLSAIRSGRDVVLSLADNGPGIPERLRDKLFQPFSASGSAGGSGLGLAIARELAQTHGGDVRLKSSSPDGTVFEIRLPMG